MHTKLLLVVLLITTIANSDLIAHFDEVRFIHTRFFTSNGYNLTIKSTDDKLNAAVRQRLTELYFDIYPQLVDRFNANAPRAIHLFIDRQTKYRFWGLSVNSKIIINGYRLRSPRLFPRYYDVFLHELANSAQQYTTQNLDVVKWLGEGLADYVRYTYGAANLDADWALPEYQSGQAYDDGYKVTARFLIWLEHRYNSSVIDELDRSLREVTYSHDTTWTELTGKSVEEWWLEYSENSDLTAHVPFLNAIDSPLGDASQEAPERADTLSHLIRYR